MMVPVKVQINREALAEWRESWQRYENASEALWQAIEARKATVEYVRGAWEVKGE